jgi:hypothetical protein
MQNYIDLAEKNGVTLLDKGSSQCCGAHTTRGIHECIEIFNLGFQEIDFTNPKNHIYRFLIVDAHALQHPEIHGRWSNHFHLTRLHLVFNYEVPWTYELSPKLSDYLNKYKAQKQNEYLTPPELLKRGNITTTTIFEKVTNEEECKDWIRKWAWQVYEHWGDSHTIANAVAKGLLNYDE